MKLNKKQVAAILTGLLVGYAAYQKVINGVDMNVDVFINAINALLGV